MYSLSRKNWVVELEFDLVRVLKLDDLVEPEKLGGRTGVRLVELLLEVLGELPVEPG